VDDPIHVNVQIISLEAGGVRLRGIEGDADGALTTGEMDAFFVHILYYLRIFL